MILTLICWLLPDRGYLSHRSGKHESHGIHKQLRKSHKFQSCANQCWCNNIIDKKGTVIRQKYTIPLHRIIIRLIVICLSGFYDNLKKCSQTRVKITYYNPRIFKFRLITFFDHKCNFVQNSSITFETMWLRNEQFKFYNQTLIQ